MIINIFEKYISFKTTNVSIFYETKTKDAIKIRRVIKIMKKKMIFFEIIAIIFVMMKNKTILNNFLFSNSF